MTKEGNFEGNFEGIIKVSVISEKDAGIKL